MITSTIFFENLFHDVQNQNEYNCPKCYHSMNNVNIINNSLIESVMECKNCGYVEILQTVEE